MTCQDAPHLLKLRREISANKHLSVETINALITVTNDIRWAHELESPDCACWQKARMESAHGIERPKPEQVRRTA